MDSRYWAARTGKLSGRNPNPNPTSMPASNTIAATQAPRAVTPATTRATALERVGTRESPTAKFLAAMGASTNAPTPANRCAERAITTNAAEMAMSGGLAARKPTANDAAVSTTRIPKGPTQSIAESGLSSSTPTFMNGSTRVSGSAAGRWSPFWLPTNAKAVVIDVVIDGFKRLAPIIRPAVATASRTVLVSGAHSRLHSASFAISNWAAPTAPYTSTTPIPATADWCKFDHTAASSGRSHRSGVAFPS